MFFFLDLCLLFYHVHLNTYSKENKCDVPLFIISYIANATVYKIVLRRYALNAESLMQNYKDSTLLTIVSLLVKMI